MTVTTAGSAFRDVEIVDGDTVFLGGGGSGWPPTKTLYNPETGAFSGLSGSVYYSGVRTVLTEDKHLTLLAEPNNSSGPLMLFDDRTNSIVAQGDNYQTIGSSNRTGYNFGSQAISEAAGLVLQFIYPNTVLVYDLNLKYLRFFQVPGVVDGMVFDPTGAYVYIYEIESGYLSKYAVGSGTRIDQYFVGTSTWHNDIGYGSQLLINSDGTRITIVDTNANIGKLRMVDLTGAGYFAGTAGADSFAGRKGDDIYIVNHAGDSITEQPNEGNDTVESNVATYLLGTNVENLTGRLTTGQSLRGNGLANAVTGGAGNDILLLQDGGDDSAVGGGGNDQIFYGAALTAADSNDGGAGTDVVILQGNYALTLGAGALTNVEYLSLQSGSSTRYQNLPVTDHAYDITSVDSNVAAGQRLIVNASQLLDGESFTFDGSAESDGSFLIYGGYGADVLTGGAGHDVFHFEGSRWGSGDAVDGGAGADSVVIRAGAGTHHIQFGETQLTGVESISVSDRFGLGGSSLPSYEMVLANGNVAAGATLIINASTLLDPAQTLSVDGSAVGGGHLRLYGGAGGDTLIGGDGDDLFFAAGGADRMTGGEGRDTFQLRSLSDSPASGADRILDFVSGTDKIDLRFIDADSNTAGDQAFAFVGAAFTGNGTAGSGAAGELRAYQDSESGAWIVEGDVNGDGNADFQVVVISSEPLVGSDFIA